jgi:hypothetical protein
VGRVVLAMAGRVGEGHGGLEAGEHAAGEHDL